jgi:hypothetical protein
LSLQAHYYALQYESAEGLDACRLFVDRVAETLDLSGQKRAQDPLMQCLSAALPGETRSAEQMCRETAMARIMRLALRLVNRDATMRQRFEAQLAKVIQGRPDDDDDHDDNDSA